MSEHKKKILFFLPTLGQGGGERVVSEVSLHEPGSVECVAVVFSDARQPYAFGGRIRSLGLPLTSSFGIGVYRTLQRFSRFKKIVEEESPDDIVTIGGLTAMIAIL